MEKLVNGYLAERNYDIYIIGSNSKLLSGKLATKLTGRFVEIKVYPFSFREFLVYKSENNQYLDKYKHFKEYFKFGGMPNAFEFEDLEKIQYLRDLFNSIIFKDVVERNEVRNIDIK